jgi:hypothetical protein
MVYAARLDDLDRQVRLRAAGLTSDPARQLDIDLGVTGWPTGAAVAFRPRPAGVPAWWTDDEDASQGFLAAMGVHLE